MNQIRNTTQDMRDPINAALFLASQHGDPRGSGGAIEDMEAAGQHQLVTSDQLPTKLNGGTDANLIAWGFTLGEPDPRDPLFRPATLPQGWTRQADAHAMWSHLVDEHGRRRINIFYKAAFYDRRAQMNVFGVDSYVWQCVANDKPIITDNQWATPDQVRTALADLAAGQDEEAQQWADSPESLMRHQQRAARCRARLAELDSDAS